MRRLFIWVIGFCALCVPAVVLGSPKIIINNLDVTGIRGQSFDNVKVTFDAEGNVLISAPQYKLVDVNRGGGTGATPPPLPSVQQVSKTVSDTTPVPGKLPVPPVSHVAKGPYHYDRNTLPDGKTPTYLVVTFNEPGSFGYNVDVYINGQFVKEFKQRQGQHTLDVSKYLERGRNPVLYRLVRTADTGKSPTASVALMFSKLTGRQDGKIELSGEYSPLTIQSSDGSTTEYNTNINVP